MWSNYLQPHLAIYIDLITRWCALDRTVEERYRLLWKELDSPRRIGTQIWGRGAIQLCRWVGRTWRTATSRAFVEKASRHLPASLRDLTSPASSCRSQKHGSNTLTSWSIEKRGGAEPVTWYVRAMNIISILIGSWLAHLFPVQVHSTSCGCILSGQS